MTSGVGVAIELRDGQYKCGSFVTVKNQGKWWGFAHLNTGCLSTLCGELMLKRIQYWHPEAVNYVWWFGLDGRAWSKNEQGDLVLGVHRRT